MNSMAYLSALIQNYGDELAVIFFHHRDTEDTEKLFLIAHRETAMGNKTSTFGETINAYWNLDYLYAPASMLFVCQRPVPQHCGTAGKRKKYSSQCSLCLCGKIQLPLKLQQIIRYRIYD